MARKVASFRLDTELLDWVVSYGKTRGSSQAVVVEEAIRHFQELSKGGVPDLPVVDSPEVRQERAKPVPSVTTGRALVGSGAFADASGSRQQRLNAAALRRRAKS